MKLTKNPSGVYAVTIKTPHGERTLSTGTKDRRTAARTVKHAKVKELEAAGRVGKLTSQTISQIMVGKKVTVETALQQWITWCQTVGRSPSTINNNATFGQAWMKQMKLAAKQPNEITETDIDKWVNDTKSEGKAGSRAVKLSILRSFFDFCAARGYAFQNPAALVRVKMNLLSHEQKEPRQKKPFTDLEIKRLMANTQGFWNAAVALGRYAGLRLGDICQLEWACFKKGKLVVWTDKRDRRVELPVPDPLAEAVATVPVKDKQYLFPEERAKISEPKLRSYFSVTFGRICKRLEMAGHTFHDLRHTYATECRKKGIPMPHISESLGHTSERVTKGYVHD